MSDTPIFDRLALARGYDRMVDRKPNGKTSQGAGFFVRAVREPERPYTPDSNLDGPLHLIGAQNATEVPLDEEDEIWIATSDREKITSLVIPDSDPKAADKPTHEFPRVDITGFVDKKIEGGLYAYLRASGQVVEAQYQSGGQEPQKGFRGLLDGILQDARRELPQSTGGIASILEPGEFTIERVCPDYDGPQQIVIAEITVRGENTVDNPEFIDALLDQLVQKAKEKYPRHIPVSVDVLSPMDFKEDGFIFRLKGVEGALPVYSPAFEGDKREDSVGSDVFSQTREESIVSLVHSPSKDPSPQYPFALPMPLFETTEEHDEE